MKQAYLIIDIALCHDCNNCFLACKDEFVDNDWPPFSGPQPRHGHRWMNILRTERGRYPRIDVAYLPLPCQHCADAPCQKAHPDCITRRPDGIVVINPEKAKGNKALVDSCPYGAIYWNEALEVGQKCTMCAHILDEEGGVRQPRCAHGCPTGALTFAFMEPEEMAKRAAAEGLEHYRPELGSRPNVYYKNLHRFEKAFIAGGLLRNGDCAEGVTVTLHGPKGQSNQVSDEFGDFKFDALEPGAYRIEAEGRELAAVELKKESLNLDMLTL